MINMNTCMEAIHSIYAKESYTGMHIAAAATAATTATICLQIGPEFIVIL